MTPLYRLAKPLLFRLDPERAHALSIAALKSGLMPRRNLPVDSRLAVEVAGLRFPNPLGLAAGYDKNAEVPDALLRLGFGFVEVGTLTPRPQAGNEPPRLFRLPDQSAVINRLGFNNDGQADAFERLCARVRKAGIVGVNIGANKDSPDRIRDYVEGVNRFEAVARYLTINISSPNTPGLRRLQEGTELKELIDAVIAARNGFAALAALPRRPVFLKVAPDLEPYQIEAIADAATTHGLDGLIVSNTTLSRRGVERARFGTEKGGLSGLPLFERSTYVLAAFRKAVGPNFPLIGVGGIDSARSALAKIEAGADLVQLYTGLVFGGPDLPLAILHGLRHHLARTGATSLREFRDATVDEVLARGSRVF